AVFEDTRHSSGNERRYILYGRSLEGRVLMTAFALRASKIRIISARTASRKERKIYEERKEKT
ncbi:MAG TPA: BrnT family toxin, partial [Bdellovibrionota bacterium]|nr:BrnT family toxin [Bdellovibrionota bacterium]